MFAIQTYKKLITLNFLLKYILHATGWFCLSDLGEESYNDDNYNDDGQYNDPIEDDGASLSDDPPENEVFPEDVSQGNKWNTKVQKYFHLLFNTYQKEKELFQ